MRSLNLDKDIYSYIKQGKTILSGLNFTLDWVSILCFLKKIKNKKFGGKGRGKLERKLKGEEKQIFTNTVKIQITNQPSELLRF